MRASGGIAVVVLVLSACVTQIRPVPKHWDHATDPKCTEGYDWVAADVALTVASGSAGLVIAAKTEDRDTAGKIALGGLVVAVVFAIAADVGYDDVNDCHTAKEQWRVATAVVRRHANDDASVTAPPRGFFCASSPTIDTASLCTRERTTCETARSSALAAIPDLGSCVLVETAWCFRAARSERRCAGTQASCLEQVRSATDAAGECRETK